MIKNILILCLVVLLGVAVAVAVYADDRTKNAYRRVIELSEKNRDLKIRIDKIESEAIRYVLVVHTATARGVETVYHESLLSESACAARAISYQRIPRARTECWKVLNRPSGGGSNP